MSEVKRTDYLSWDDYFMGIAFLSSFRSKDPKTQVGCCIISSDKHIIGIGYNGFPIGCSDEELPWSREDPLKDPLNTKYPYVVHAELNAILNRNTADSKMSAKAARRMFDLVGIKYRQFIPYQHSININFIDSFDKNIKTYSNS